MIVLQFGGFIRFGFWSDLREEGGGGCLGLHLADSGKFDLRIRVVVG